MRIIKVATTRDLFAIREAFLVNGATVIDGLCDVYIRTGTELLALCSLEHTLCDE